MKILLICSEPVDYTIAWANGLAPHAEVIAILPRQRYDHLREWIDPRVTLMLIDWPRTRSLLNIAFLWQLTRRVRDVQPDVIHLLSNTTVWLNAAVPFWGDIPVVTTVHDVALHPGDRETARLPAWSSRLMARQSSHLVVHGAGLKSAAEQAFRKSEGHVHVFQHPGIARYAQLATRLGLSRSSAPDAFVVLLFGRIFAYKGLTTLLRAEACLGDRIPNLRIVIAGRGDNPDDYRHLMGDRARYDIRHGFVEDAVAAQLFTDADLVVLPYDEASQSGVLHLATTFGKPILATDVGELRATIEPNGLGRIVPPGRPDLLADAMAELAADPDTRARLAANARAWSDGANAPTTIGQSATALYRQLAVPSHVTPPN